MISDLQFTLNLIFSLAREVDGGAWPPASQVDNQFLARLQSVDLTVWNRPLAVKLPIAGGATETIDLQNFETLLFEAGASMDKAFLMAVQVREQNPAELDCSVEIRPGAANGFTWFFTDPAEGIKVKVGQTMCLTCAGTDVTGDTVDATHKTLDFHNPGGDGALVTVVIIGGE